MGQVQVKVCYYEILNADITGVLVELHDGLKTKLYCNFDPTEHVEQPGDRINQKIFLNQTEKFKLPAWDIAEAFYESCESTYSEIERKELLNWLQYGFEMGSER